MYGTADEPRGGPRPLPALFKLAFVTRQFAIALLVPVEETRLRGRLRDRVAEAEGTEPFAGSGSGNGGHGARRVASSFMSTAAGEARIGGAVLL